MGAPVITTPVGIDIPLKYLQSFLNSQLFSGNSYEAYARAYLVDGIPYVYVGSREYQELLFNDVNEAQSFFMVGDREEINVNHYQADVDIVFFVDLATCYPTITHRADEECVREIWQLLTGQPASFKLTSIKTGENALDGIKYTDTMQPYFIAKFSGTLIYNYQNEGC